jgi:hypothetical protein
MKFIRESLDLLGKHLPGSEEDFDYAKPWTGLTEQLLAEGKLKPSLCQA